MLATVVYFWFNEEEDSNIHLTERLGNRDVGLSHARKVTGYNHNYKVTHFIQMEN